MKPFTDNFSKQSNSYQKFRPTYPKELFAFLSSQTDEHDLAWDCGTGNGQSAVGLADFYKSVYATDPSEAQINNATQNPKIIYKVEIAEKSSLEDKSVDILTVAQAIHWFDFDKFYTEAKRVLKENGVIAVWTYTLPSITIEIDALIQHFHDNIVGAFWQAENKLVENEYKTIPFPFEVIPSSDFTIHKQISRHDLVGLLRSWSATQKYIDKHDQNPIDQIDSELLTFWPDDQEKSTSWKLILKLGRNSL